jgi:hypothetical protein
VSGLAANFTQSNFEPTGMTLTLYRRGSRVASFFWLNQARFKKRDGDYYNIYDHNHGNRLLILMA